MGPPLHIYLFSSIFQTNDINMIPDDRDRFSLSSSYNIILESLGIAQSETGSWGTAMPMVKKRVQGLLTDSENVTG